MPTEEPARLTVDDLESLAEEATRQRLSLACLIAAMESGEPIAWMTGESVAAR